MQYNYLLIQTSDYSLPIMFSQWLHVNKQIVGKHNSLSQTIKYWNTFILSFLLPVQPLRFTSTADWSKSN